MSWVGVEFNAPHNIIKVILEVVFTVNLLTDTDKQTVQENTDAQTQYQSKSKQPKTRQNKTTLV